MGRIEIQNVTIRIRFHFISEAFDFREDLSTSNKTVKALYVEAGRGQKSSSKQND